MLEVDKNYCPFRITRDTIQFGNRVVVPRDQIPGEGACSASETGREPCYYASNVDLCQIGKTQAFGDRSWAKSAFGEKLEK